jgi:putative FmdB family regulatory protein
MPIYEYQAAHPGDRKSSCDRCRRPFEVLQVPGEPPLTLCPECGKPLKKLISWCRAAVVETPAQVTAAESRIRGYEKEGMWSHAAELADKQAEKVNDPGLRTRALENYEKAGYDAGTLSRYDRDD